MTFIASVIAKKGVAIIADSLVTSVRPVIEFEDFHEYTRPKQSEIDNSQIESEDVSKLFQDKPSHTKDYEEKLFEYDRYTAITAAGCAVINDKRIAEIVSKFREYNHNRSNRKSYNSKTTETKVKDFCTYLTREVKEHLKNNKELGDITFIYTNYNPTSYKTVIYKINIGHITNDTLHDENYQYVIYELQEEHYKVVCDGQNRISERILFGDENAIESTIPKIINSVLDNFGIDRQEMTSERFIKIVNDSEVLNSNFWDDMKIFQLSELSLQQAVDLACLLMRMEVDIQKYTKNIPTVGGVIKLAVIDDKGFRYIHGHDIIKPPII